MVMKRYLALVVGLALLGGSSMSAAQTCADVGKSCKCPAVSRDGLSQIREKMLDLVDQVFPSMQGEKKQTGVNILKEYYGIKDQKEYAKLVKAKKPIPTSCGFVGGMLLRLLFKDYVERAKREPKLSPLKWLFTGGTTGVPGWAKKLGAFVVADGTNLPKPGDLFVLRDKKIPDDTRLANVAHVGTIIEVNKDGESGTVWVTADGGQGAAWKQTAVCMCRKAERKKTKAGARICLKGPSNTVGDSPECRVIGGWVDLDNLYKAIQK
jgi:hypothetical protein